MPIFKNKNKKAYIGTVFIGAWLPAKTVSYLVLYCLFERITKTALIKSAILDFVSSRSKDWSITTLKNQTASRIVSEWKIRLHNNPSEKFTDFKLEVKAELLKKGVELETVIEILNKVKA